MKSKPDPKTPQQIDPNAAPEQQQGEQPAAGGGDPPLQGEGNYSAARRHRESLKEFIDSGRVEPAAEQARPADAQQAGELEEAEKAGRSHAKR